MSRIRFNLDMASIAKRLGVTEGIVHATSEPTGNPHEKATEEAAPEAGDKSDDTTGNETDEAQHANAHPSDKSAHEATPEPDTASGEEDDVIFVATYQRTFKYQPKITRYFKPALRDGEVIDVD